MNPGTRLSVVNAVRAPRRNAFAAVLVGLLAVFAVWLLLRSDDSRPASPRAGGEAPDAAVAGGAEVVRPRVRVTEEPEVAPAAALPFASGIVVDEQGAGIAGAHVVVRPIERFGGNFPPDAGVIDPAVAPRVATTDAEGRFRADARPEEMWSLVAFAAGREIAEVPGLTDDPARNQDLRVVLREFPGLAGRVEDTDGRPIAGATVRLFRLHEDQRSGISVSADSDANGRYAFECVPGECEVSVVTEWGYESLHSQPVSGTPQDFTLTRSTLIVDVLDAATNAPLPEARGVVVRGADRALVAPLEQPWLRYGGSAPPMVGRLLVWAWKPPPDDLPVVVHVRAPGHLSRAVAAVLPARGEPPHLVVSLEPGEEAPAISGRVRNAREGTVSVGLLVPERPIDPDSRITAVATAAIADDGTFAVSGLPPGRYRVVVDVPSHALAGLDVEVPGSALEVDVEPAAVLEVRVEDSSGAAVAGEWVHVQSRGLHWFANERTDEQGRVVFDRVLSGALRISPGIRQDWHLWTDDFATLGLPGLDLTVGPGERVVGTLRKPGRVPLELSVVDETGSPCAAEIAVAVRGGFAAFQREDRQRVEATPLRTDEHGQATLDLFPGRYRLTLSGQGFRRTERIEVVEGMPPLVVTIPRGPRRLQGRVVERRTTAPVAGRAVQVSRGGSPQPVASAVTDRNGGFVVEGLPEGDLTLVVLAGSTPDGARDRDSPWPTVTVDLPAARAAESSLWIVVPRTRGENAEPSDVEVRVRVAWSDDATPLRDATVFLRGLLEGGRFSAGGARTDEHGIAVFRTVAAEGYRAEASVDSPSGERIAASAESGPGQHPVEIEVRLER